VSRNRETHDRRTGDIDGRTFDLAVIGGGMAGAGIARDAALRGYRTLLLERRDFAFGTTSRSSKLIHGGLRYLELLDVGLVRESLRERERLARLAPHLVRPLPFLVPVYRGAKRGMFMIRIGMKLYDLLNSRQRTDRYRTIPRDETLRLERYLEPRDLFGVGATISTTSSSCRSGCAWRTSCPPSAGGPRSTTTPSVVGVGSTAPSAERRAPPPITATGKLTCAAFWTAHTRG